jgi:hypothetical protein
MALRVVVRGPVAQMSRKTPARRLRLRNWHIGATERYLWPVYPLIGILGRMRRGANNAVRRLQRPTALKKRVKHAIDIAELRHCPSPVEQARALLILVVQAPQK